MGHPPLQNFPKGHPEPTWVAEAGESNPHYCDRLFVWGGVQRLVFLFGVICCREIEVVVFSASRYCVGVARILVLAAAAVRIVFLHLVRSVNR